jgi:alpha-L-rhamnosidase
VPGGGLTHARARHRTPYGLAECTWKIDAGQIEVQVVVPPNTTAQITLPRSDGETLEVSSGMHRWAYAYQDSTVVRQPLSLDSRLGELVDDPEAWMTVLTTMRQHVPEFADQVVGILQGNSDLTLQQVLSFRPNTDALREALEAALGHQEHRG